MSNWSIRKRLFVATAFFTLICVALFQLLWVPRVTTVLVEAERREVQRQVDVLIDGLVPFILSNQNAAIYETLNNIEDQFENWHRILVVRDDDRQIYPLHDVEQATGANIIGMSRDIHIRGETWGRIEIDVDLSEQLASLHSELRRLGAAALSFLTLSIAVLGFFVDRIITKRLVKLAAAADKLGAGDYDAELPRPGNDEVGRLTESFGAMRHRIVENISSFNEARQQAETALETKSRFLATVSHELRTPLNGIIPVAEILEASPLDAHQIKLVETIKQSSRSLLTIVDDILDLTQMEEGRLELRRVRFEPRKLVEGVTDMLKASAQEKALSLNYDVDAGVGTYFGDEDRIRQILVNLTGNAIKFTETGGVTIRCRWLSEAEGRSQIQFEVEDSGIGIKEADHERIFVRFEQAEGGLARRFGGSGLGLAITKSLVDALGGEMGLRSEYGKGSVFSLTIPLDNADAENGMKLEAEHGFSQDARCPHAGATEAFDILVVDDNTINLEITKAILGTHGHRVQTVTNGREAVTAAEHSDFDLILMDVHMSEMDGLEATRRIRALPSGRSGTLIIALTASIFDDDKSRCLAAGMNDVLAKPFTHETILRSVEKLRVA